MGWEREKENRKTSPKVGAVGLFFEAEAESGHRAAEDCPQDQSPPRVPRPGHRTPATRMSRHSAVYHEYGVEKPLSSE